MPSQIQRDEAPAAAVFPPFVALKMASKSKATMTTGSAMRMLFTYELPIRKDGKVGQSVSLSVKESCPHGDGYTAVDTGALTCKQSTIFSALSPCCCCLWAAVCVAYYYHDFDWPLLGKHASQRHRGHVPGHQPEREVQTAVPADIEGHGEECQQAEVVRYPPAGPEDRVEHGGFLGRVVFVVVDVVVERVDSEGCRGSVCSRHVFGGTMQTKGWPCRCGDGMGEVRVERCKMQGPAKIRKRISGLFFWLARALGKKYKFYCLSLDHAVSMVWSGLSSETVSHPSDQGFVLCRQLFQLHCRLPDFECRQRVVLERHSCKGKQG